MVSRRIPRITAGVTGGARRVLANSLRDLSVPMILMTTGNVVLSSTLWMLWGYPNVPGAAALSMIMIAGLLLIVVSIQIRVAATLERRR